ncbi:MAG: GntR family transcriptional regulator [Hyphomicrobiaceae bacterium]|nr:GntR family transcriptional regulator [Hyphomicrobiaceae bacterium]
MAEQKSSRAGQVARQILSIARREGLESGARLVEQRLAEALGVSRGPVRAGLKALAAAGLVTGERNCGYVLAKNPVSDPAGTAIATSDQSELAYRRIADDCLDGRLPEVVTEAELMRRYKLTRAQLLRLLDRVASEGWCTRLQGYGWRFAETVSSREAYSQAAAFRAVIEPAALSERSYRLDAHVIDRLRSQQQQMSDRGLQVLTIGEIFQSGCEFHEEIIRGAGNPFYVEALKRVNSIRRLLAYRTYADEDGMRRHIREHLRLLDLIAGGRMTEAVGLMRRHLQRPPRARLE